MGSCVSTLRRIQHDVGITDKELKDAVREVCTPRRVELPVLREKKSPERKLKEKLEKKSKKRRRKEVAVWYLTVFLLPEVAQQLYEEYTDYDQLMDTAYEQGMNMIQLATLSVGEPEPHELIPAETLDDFDIPDHQWKAFGEYCKKHPIKKASQISERRRKFKKWIQKKAIKRYSPKRLRIYDPVYAATAPSAKEMLKNLKRISYENELRIQRFHAMLNELVGDRSVGSIAMQHFKKQSEEIMRQHQKRIKEFKRRAKGDKPTPVVMYWDDQEPVEYDNWDNPKSMDSVLGIKVEDIK